MSTKVFDKWIKAYGRAWETKNVEKFAGLFTEDAQYYWTPFDEPKQGVQEIADAFRSAVSRQDDIHFGRSWIHINRELGIAHWWCSFTRVPDDYTVHIDGCMVIKITRAARCKEFWQWWHTDEAHH